MPRKPSIPCAGGCGKLLYDNFNRKDYLGLPPGQATCNECRTKKTNRPRVCRGCGGVFTPTRGRKNKTAWCTKACYDSHRAQVAKVKKTQSV